MALASEVSGHSFVEDDAELTRDDFLLVVRTVFDTINLLDSWTKVTLEDDEDASEDDEAENSEEDSESEPGDNTGSEDSEATDEEDEAAESEIQWKEDGMRNFYLGWFLYF